MRKIRINSGWLFSRLGESDKIKVDLPHDAMLREDRRQEYKGKKNNAYFAGGDYVYEKMLAVQKKQGCSYILEFEGVYRNARVRLNGEEVAYRPYGYANFSVDLTEKICDGENKIEVFAYCSDIPNSRWYSGAGIYRNVNFYELPEKHIKLDGIKVKTLDYKTGEVEIKVNTSASGSVKIYILDGDGICVNKEVETDGDSSVKLVIPNVKLWNTKTPNLYTCRVAFEDDVDEVKFGVRQIECNSKDGFLINGERVIIKGACIHHDNGLLGACAYDYAEERKVLLMQKAGYNALRSAHNPCSKALLDACDKYGMLVMDEYVDVWYIHKTKYDYADYCMDWWRQDLKDIVDKDYNHPSVIMYSTGNEVSETAQPKGIKFCGDMTEYLHELDSTRPVSCGINIFFNYLSSMGFGVYSDKKAEKEPDKAVGSEFFNKLAGLLGDKTMKIGASLHGSDVKTRDAFANLDVAGYNYGILRYKKDFKKYPNRVILGSETFCKDAYTFYEIAKKNNALIGDFVWAGQDYIGEVGIGSWEYRDYARDFNGDVGWMTAGSGRVDLVGNELGEALYTKVAFELLPIAIAVIPVDNATKEHSPSAWKMTNARESWSWNGLNGNRTKVEVYARGYKVRLFINGNKVGEKRLRNDCKAIFPVKYHDGMITAIAYDKDDKEIARTSLTTAGDETKLTVIPETDILRENDLLYVKLRYTDNEGVIKPLTRGRIDVEAENGEILGLGHACPYNPDGYLNDFTDTYYGEALAIIKPTSDKDVTVRASSVYGDAKITVKVQK